MVTEIVKNSVLIQSQIHQTIFNETQVINADDVLNSSVLTQYDALAHQLDTCMLRRHGKTRKCLFLSAWRFTGTDSARAVALCAVLWQCMVIACMAQSGPCLVLRAEVVVKSATRNCLGFWICLIF